MAKKQKKIQIAKEQSITQDNHDKLLKHVKSRLAFGGFKRGDMIDRYEKIDREIACYLLLDKDDTKREIDNDRGYGVKPTDTKLPLIMAQLDEAATFLLSVLAPDDAMYTAMATDEKQDIAKGFSSLMNKHASQFHHYTNLVRFLFDGLKYNLGGIGVDWKKVYGNKIKNNQARTGVEIVREVVEDGNMLSVFDMYNFIYDISVLPYELAAKGEFFADVAVHTAFRVRKMAADGEIFNIDELMKSYIHGTKYYRAKPNIRSDVNYGDTETDWVSILTAGAGSDSSSNAIEFVNLRIWIDPKEFGLGQKSEMQIWRITLAANQFIVAAEQLTNAHGMLPLAMTMPWIDGMGTAAKSYGEYLVPYQRFSSFQFNVHQRAARKALYGLTIYDKNKLPLMETADVLAGKVPVNTLGQGERVSDYVAQFNDTPDTSNTLRDIDAVDGLMQKILPTDMLKQVTSLERATQYQAAATVQGANRRNLKIAKIINDQAMDDIRKLQMFNILQFQESVSIMNENGEEVEVNPADFRDAGLEFEIADGLRGLDKLVLIETFKDILNAALQSQQINESLDLVDLLNYMTTLLGDKTNLAQFKFKTQFDALSRQEKDIAFQLLQQALAAQQQQPGQQGTASAGSPPALAPSQ